MKTPRPILLVEDNEDDVFFMQRAFKAAEVFHPIQVVNNGQAAVDYLAGADPYRDRNTYPLPCMILLDLKMPKKSGLEVLQWIREQRPAIPSVVLILTSSREESDIQRAYQLGVNSYLVKPPNAVELNALIRLMKTYWLENPQIAVPQLPGWR
jgi:CheY-like chemotaxis protein